MSDAAWAKENLARAKPTLPNGYCGLPLQQPAELRPLALLPSELTLKAVAAARERAPL